MTGALLPTAAFMAGAAFRLAMACVLAEAARHALRNRLEFLGIVQAYRFGPAGLAPVAAVGLPALEIVAAGMLVLPAAAPFGLALATALLCLFGAAIGVNLARGRTDIDCGCGSSAQKISGALLMRNLVLVAGLLAAAAAPVALPVDAAATVGIGGLAVFLTFLYFAANQMLANARRFADAGWTKAA